MILALDVHYRTDTAKTVCIVFHNWTDEKPADMHTTFTADVAEYEPGAFYKRELPCLLEALKSFSMNEIAVIVIDGYVVLDDNGKPGLGAHLFDALEQKIPVIGVAKTRFFSNTQFVAEIFRGESQNPLFVTAAGIPLDIAADHIRSMAGPYRMPGLLKLLDSETKG